MKVVTCKLLRCSCSCFKSISMAGAPKSLIMPPTKILTDLTFIIVQKSYLKATASLTAKMADIMRTQATPTTYGEHIQRYHGMLCQHAHSNARKAEPAPYICISAYRHTYYGTADRRTKTTASTYTADGPNGAKLSRCSHGWRIVEMSGGAFVTAVVQPKMEQGLSFVFIYPFAYYYNQSKCGCSQFIKKRGQKCLPKKPLRL